MNLLLMSCLAHALRSLLLVMRWITLLGSPAYADKDLAQLKLNALAEKLYEAICICYLKPFILGLLLWFMLMILNLPADVPLPNLVLFNILLFYAYASCLT